MPGLAVRKLMERAFGDAPGGGDITGAHLHDAAAMSRPAHDVISNAERVHDVERKQRDMRRLEHVAAGIKDEIGNSLGILHRGRPLGALP